MGYIITNIRSEYANRETGNREIIASVVCDDAASLPVQRADQTFVLSSDALDISTGDRYIINSLGQWILQPSANAWENMYTKAEIDEMNSVSYQYMMYYHGTLESTDGSITFYTFGGDVSSLTIYGNGEQTGTPSPSAPITPGFVGTLDGTDWTIPITCAGQTVPVYLGQTQTVRKIRKLVLDETSNFTSVAVPGGIAFVYNPVPYPPNKWSTADNIISSHYKSEYSNKNGNIYFTTARLIIVDFRFETVDAYKAYIAQQYSNGTPVTVWYVLAEPTTGIVNEPLAKIGDYADELHSEDAAVTIPTAKGQNTLTVDTELQPSLIEISGGIMHE